MQSIVSDSGAAPHLGPPLADDSAAGHALALLERIRPDGGLVLDVGCRHGALAPAITAAGFQYVGVYSDLLGWSEVAFRGLETHRVALEEPDKVVARLIEVTSGRKLAAILAVGLVEHLAEPRKFLEGIHTFLTETNSAPLILTVRNVTYAEVAAHLIFGQWFYDQDEAIDRQPMHTFTASRLSAETRAAGFLEVAHNDVSDVQVNADSPVRHPLIASDSPIASLIRQWRGMVDADGATTDFVRAYVMANVSGTTLSDTKGDGPVRESQNGSDKLKAARFLTVVLRTQGRRPTTLRDALTCLAAQTVEAFDVELIVHSDEEADLMSVRAIAEDFDPVFTERVTVTRLPARGGRSRPLNVALARARSRYIAFLDDDDLVTATWVEAFLESADDSSIVRSQSAARHVRPATNSAMPYLVASAIDFPFDEEFSMPTHFWQNQTPICSFAVPMRLIETFNLRFDEQLSVLEDWDFLLRTTSLAAVRETRAVTSIVNLWLEGESSRSAHNARLWKSLEHVIQERLDALPTVLPAGSVSALVEMQQQQSKLRWEANAVYENNQELLTALSESEARVRGLEEVREQLCEQLADMRKQLLQLGDDHQLVLQSKRWRILEPAARGVALQRKWRQGRKR